MKAEIHPKYHQATVRCACGNEFTVGSTKPEIRLDICSACHPFFTGKQKFVDTAGRVDKFFRKYGEEAQKQYVKKKKKRKRLSDEEAAAMDLAADAEASEETAGQEAAAPQEAAEAPAVEAAAPEAGN